VDIDRIKTFIKLLEESDLKKLKIKEEDFELLLEKEDIHKPHLPSSPTPVSVPHKIVEPQQEEGSFITCPMVGTFYRKPGPDQPGFVKKGDRVEKDTVVCIVEAMKVMNEVKAGLSGVIEEVLVEDGHPVEYGTKMFRII
jgi:acetyl-CoA carboxylase biotin carboxyl carrier protein